MPGAGGPVDARPLGKGCATLPRYRGMRESWGGQGGWVARGVALGVLGGCGGTPLAPAPAGTTPEGRALASASAPAPAAPSPSKRASFSSPAAGLNAATPGWPKLSRAEHATSATIESQVPPPTGRVEPGARAGAPPLMPRALLVIESLHRSAFPPGERSLQGGWGRIVSIDIERREIVFDLYRVTEEVPDDDGGHSVFVNENPLLRTLPVASNAEIRACRSLGRSPPEPACGNPWLDEEAGFGFWGLADLDRIIRIQGVGLFRVLVEPATGEVIWIEQWWSP